MHDIRKPYTRSRSSREIDSQVEEFETHSYEREPVVIPRKRVRRDVHGMEMYPSKKRDKEYNEDEYDDRRNEGRDAHLHLSDRTYRDPRTKYVRDSGTLGTWAFILTMIALVLGVGLFTFVFNRATVTIVPKHTDIDDFNHSVIFSQNIGEAQSVHYIIASSSISKTKTLSLSQSKKVEAKASSLDDFDPDALLAEVVGSKIVGSKIWTSAVLG